MKKERIIEILILIFLAALLIAGAVAFNHFKFVKPNTYNIIFKDIDSIVKGSPVRFMGINVGFVQKLKRKDGYIICKIRITKDGVKIPDLTRAKVAFNGLGGSKSIELLPPLTNDGDLRGIVATETLRINDMGAMVRTLTDVCIMINRIVQELDAQLIIENVKAFTNPDALVDLDGRLQKVNEEQTANSGKVKNAAKQEGTFSDLVDFINKKIFNFKTKK